MFRNTCRDTDNLTSDGSPVHRLTDQVSLHFVTIIRVILYSFAELVIVPVIITCVQHSVDYWLWAELIGPESVRLKTLETECSMSVFFLPYNLDFQLWK